MLFFGGFFLAQRKADLHAGGFIFTHSTQWPPQKAMKLHLFLSLDLFYKMPGQNTKGSTKLLMAKKPESGPIRRRKTKELLRPTAWAARSSQKRIWLAQVFFCPVGSLEPSKVGEIRPKNLLNPCILPNGTIFVPEILFFAPFSSFFLESVTCFSHEWLKVSLIQQFKHIPNIYKYTFYVLKMRRKKILTV
jgi:hypothetical protein